MSGIVELFKEIGNENIEYQILQRSISGISTKGKDSAVTFHTRSISPNEFMAGTGKVGVIVWVDKDVYISSLNKLTAEGGA